VAADEARLEVLVDDAHVGPSEDAQHREVRERMVAAAAAGGGDVDARSPAGDAEADGFLEVGVVRVGVADDFDTLFADDAEANRIEVADDRGDVHAGREGDVGAAVGCHHQAGMRGELAQQGGWRRVAVRNDQCAHHVNFLTILDHGEVRSLLVTADTGATTRVRPMEAADLPAVMAIERESFAAGWPPTAFEHELANNGVARYVVIEDTELAAILGFGGLWLMLDEAHIVTVATRPEARRRGLATALVLALLELAEQEGMANATLECRVSNEAARALYRGLGFHEVGSRKRYYADNHEDAVIMTTEAFNSPAHGRRVMHARAAQASRRGALSPGG